MTDDTYTVQRSIIIEAPAASVFPLINDFRRWPAWSPWEDLDPALQREYTGAASGVGAVYTWSGNRKAGQGRMEIIEAVEPHRVRLDLTFEKPFPSRSDTVFTVETQGTGCQVTWSVTGRKTLMTKVMGIFISMDRLLGPDFDKGLARLKSTAEAGTTP